MIRKNIAQRLLLSALFTATLLSGCSDLTDRTVSRTMERAVAKGLSEAAMDQLPDGLHIFLCGAGSPLPDPRRSGPCVAVLAGQQLFIVDAGSGSVRNLGPAGFPPGRVDAVLLTHFHSDHIDGLGELAMQRWAGGNHKHALPVYGPSGVKAVVNGFNLAYSQDFGYRIAHHGEDVVPPQGAGLRAVPFAALGENDSTVVLERDGLRITAFGVQHTPVEPAVGYRFDYRGRSALISGDTVKSANLQRHAQGVDLLVHEAIVPRLVNNMIRGAQRAGAIHMATIAEDILDYHTTPVQAAEIARDANVGLLLYYHIVPALPNRLMERTFLRGVSDVYQGRVIVGRDGSFVSLPAGSGSIVEDNLL